MHARRTRFFVVVALTACPYFYIVVAQLLEFLLEIHSHTSAFETPCRPSKAPVAKPAAKVLPGLVVCIAQRVTSLEALPRAFIVCPRLPPWHSFLDSIGIEISASRT